MEWSEDTTSKVSSKEKECRGAVVAKAVQLLEAMHGAGGQDSRPKPRQKLHNVLHPVCAVMFMTDIARILREIFSMTGGCLNILGFGGRSTVSLSTEDLLRKVLQRGSSLSQKQRRILISATEQSKQWGSMKAQMDKWKKTMLSSIAADVQGVVGSLSSACLLSVDLEVNELVSMLLNAGLIGIDAAGKVTYSLPSKNMLDECHATMQTKFTECWEVKKLLHLKGNTAHVPPSWYWPDKTLDGMEGVILQVAVFLEKFDQYKPKTVEGLKNALKPMTSILYIGCPRSMLTVMHREMSSKNVPLQKQKLPQKRKFRNDRGKTKEEISFRVNTPPKACSVPLNKVVIQIGASLKKEKNTTSQSKSNTRCGNKSCDLTITESFSADLAWKEILTLVGQIAKRQNRVLVFLDEGEDNRCRTEVMEWLKRNQDIKETREVDHDDVAMMETEPTIVTPGNKPPNKKTAQRLQTPTNLAMTPKALLSKLASMATRKGEISPDEIVSLLEKIGYCQTQGNQVSYLNPNKTNLNTHLQEMLEQPLRGMLESFRQGETANKAVEHSNARNSKNRRWKKMKRI